MEDLKYRTYVFVEKHLSPIDKGIQAAHAVVEYYDAAKIWDKQLEILNFDRWAHFDKTLILLDGGNVNDLNELVEELSINRIHCGVFNEPDLDNIVTAVAVVVDERVYDTTKYPDAEKWILYKGYSPIILNKEFYHGSVLYKEWMEKIGGEKNLKLREIISNKRLTR